MFQHTAARRRLPDRRNRPARYARVSTHSRPKAAAGDDGGLGADDVGVSTHSRPKAAAFAHYVRRALGEVSTHSRPKAAAQVCKPRPRAHRFQHTAARRRLPMRLMTAPPPSSFNTQPPEGGCESEPPRPAMPTVSTHSRPKAAALIWRKFLRHLAFQHTAARRRLP